MAFILGLEWRVIWVVSTEYWRLFGLIFGLVALQIMVLLSSRGQNNAENSALSACSTGGQKALSGLNMAKDDRLLRVPWRLQEQIQAGKA